MPRNGRGGQRSLPPGKTSATRTDLNARQPVRVAPGGVYGSGVASADAQRIVPLPQSVLPTPGPAAAAPAAPGLAPAIPTGPPPTSIQTPPPLLSPSRRPGEPVTAGINSGPGPDSSVLGLPTSSLAEQLRQMAMTSNSPSLQALADRAQALGQ